MQPFTLHSGHAVPLDENNIDTDQIIPKQFLTAVTRSGFGQHLFHDWRYLDKHEQQPNPDFVLNQPAYKGASILLTRQNFGCGSSREHAPWALMDFGFKAVIASSFADIFYANSINNQLLPIRLDEQAIDQLFKEVKQDSQTTISIDLAAQQVSVAEQHYHFDIDPAHKHSLLNGLDAIGQTLQLADEISQFEDQIPAWQA